MEFDPRMTQETKDYVLNVLAKFSTIGTTLEEMRNFFNSRDDVNNKKDPFENVEEKEFFVDSTDDYKIPVSAYIIKDVSPKAPIVLFLHGGGFRVFTRKTYRRSLCYLAEKSKSIWLSVEYRLSPEYKHPIPTNDCLSAAKWLVENKTKLFNVDDAASIGVSGDSAGGYLAAYIAQELRKSIAFQILIYPWVDMTLGSDSYNKFTKPVYLFSIESIHDFVKDYLTDLNLKTSPSVSPLFNGNLEGLPKCLFLNAEMDPFIGDAYSYHKKLQDAGISTEMHVIKGSIHGFFHSYFNYKNAFLEGANEILKFLNSL